MCFIFQMQIIITTTLFLMEPVHLYFFILLWTHHSASHTTTGKLNKSSLSAQQQQELAHIHLFKLNLVSWSLVFPKFDTFVCTSLIIISVLPVLQSTYSSSRLCWFTTVTCTQDISSHTVAALRHLAPLRPSAPSGSGCRTTLCGKPACMRCCLLTLTCSSTRESEDLNLPVRSGE